MSFVKIELSQGKCALIDECDSHLADHKWYYKDGYATRRETRNGKRVRLYLQREIVPQCKVRFEDGNRLNCTRANLLPTDPYEDSGIWYVPLQDGQRSIIDADDAKHFIGMRCYIADGYVHCGEGDLLHRVVMGVSDGVEIDHINRDPLDNRKQNLRVCDRYGNTRNVGLRKDNLSGLKGVNAKNRRWNARIQNDKTQTYIGSFRRRRHAAWAYDQAAKKFHKKFAILNSELAPHLGNCPPPKGQPGYSRLVHLGFLLGDLHE